MSSSRKRDLTGLVDQGIVSAGTLFTTTIFIRGAGLEEFGIYSLVGLVLLFATAIQHAAVVSPAYALLPKLGASAAANFRGWLVIVQVGFLLLLLATLAGSWVAPGFSLLPHAPGLLAALLFLTTRQAYSFLRLQLFAEESGPRRALIVDALHAALSTVGLGILAWKERLDARSGLFMLAACALVAALVALPRFLQLGCTLGVPDQALRARHLRLSKWLVGKAMAQWFTANSFLTALGTLQGPAALGGVRAAQTLIGVAGVVIQGFENIIPSRAAAAFAAGGLPQLRGFMAASIKRWSLLLCLGLLPIVAFPDFFLRLLTGRSQADLREPVLLFGVATIIALAILFLQVCLRSVERVGALFWAQLASGLAGALAAIPVTTHFGIRGCILGMIAQQLIVLALLLGPAKRQLQKFTPDPDA